jgi:putative endonuclease
MFTVYVLYSPKFNKIYIGYTSNLEQRLLSHNELGKKGWTIKFRPWIVIHTEELGTKAEAMKREKQLKSAKVREFIWKMIRDLNKLVRLISARWRTLVRVQSSLLRKVNHGVGLSSFIN